MLRLCLLAYAGNDQMQCKFSVHAKSRSQPSGSRADPTDLPLWLVRLIIRILSDPVGSRTDPGGFPLSFAYFCACIPNGSCRIPSDPARILSVYLFCCTRFYVDPVRILSDPGIFRLFIVRFCAWSLKGSRAPANGFLCFSYAFLKGSRADPAGSCTDPAHLLTKARRNLNIFELQC